MAGVDGKTGHTAAYTDISAVWKRIWKRQEIFHLQMQMQWQRCLKVLKWTIALGHVSFSKTSKNTVVVAESNCFLICGSKLSVCDLTFISSAQQQEQDPTNLYISNLPVSMDEQELEGMLKSFGQVISTRILRDANGTSRGVGFARSVFNTMT